MFHAHDNHPADCIKQNVLNFYSDAAIHDAKQVLWNAYETYLPKSTERRGATSLPYVFVAVNLRNLPREQ